MSLCNFRLRIVTNTYVFWGTTVNKTKTTYGFSDFYEAQKGDTPLEKDTYFVLTDPYHSLF